MEAVSSIGALLLLLSTVRYSLSLCQMHPTNNSREVCERRYNIDRHEIVAGLRTRKQVNDLCSVYPEYEDCLKELIKDCPEDQSFLDMQGYDQKTTLIAFKGFCANKEVYLKGVDCYKASYSAILVCFSNHSTGRENAMADLQATNDWDKFYNAFCPFQVDGAKCVTDAVSNCETDVQKNMENIAYTLMHGRCKDAKYGAYQSDYDRMYGSGSVMTPFKILFLALCILCGKIL